MMLATLMFKQVLVTNPVLVITTRLVIDISQDDVTHAYLAAV